jgi:hypothetical protein
MFRSVGSEADSSQIGSMVEFEAACPLRGSSSNLVSVQQAPRESRLLYFAVIRRGRETW